MNYNSIAPYYQFLSKIIFGKSLINIQVRALQSVPNTGSLLIAGGGDGEILKHIKTFKGDIVFVELSEKMISIAKQKNKQPIHWVNENILTYQNDRCFDTIFLPFLLDNLTIEETKVLLKKLVNLLKPKGKLIIVDFTENPNFWQKKLMSSMYTFFRITSNVKVKIMPPVTNILIEQNFQLESTSLGYGGFLEAKTYS